MLESCLVGQLFLSKKEDLFMRNKKVELLAPAGNYESFLGAIHAGADAVYLGGQKFGARAYAGNFAEDELCQAIEYAHLFDRKVYLTLNTLVKENEFSELYEYLLPYYEKGLDGIIVQDMGVFKFIKEVFPKLPLHISTQAMVTGNYGANFLKEQGASRIVPARELSLAEIIKIKEKVDIELETFIHGAMCYCYSGQCLFSSIVGGRSGNRGRCAQPCRLPYKIMSNGKQYFKKETYPLSLKDMCTLYDVPKLIEAGIDSFKIEGRMKKPEYVAGVTSIYRKYIDLYYKNPKEFIVSKKDIELLSHLYIRSEIQNGYYFKHNGKEMITLNSPTYSGSDEQILNEIRNTYLKNDLKIKIEMYLYCHALERLSLKVKYQDKTIEVFGTTVELAKSSPLGEEDLEDRIRKTGNTCFDVIKSEVDLHGNCFVPIKEINSLRRKALDELKDAILKQNIDRVNKVEDSEFKSSEENNMMNIPKTGFSILVSTKQQLEGCKRYLHSIERLYIDSEVCLDHHVDLHSIESETEIFLTLPYVIREENQKYFKLLKKFLTSHKITGFLVRNVEELGWLRTMEDMDFQVAFDASLYIFNHQAIKFYQDVFNRKEKNITLTFPYELNVLEKRKLKGFENASYEQIIYGHIPMMITANCLKKTTGHCGDGNNQIFLVDRYQHSFPVDTVCELCYNVIWNCIPLSLHSKVDSYSDVMKRIMFTVESAREVEQILSYYFNNGKNFPVKDYTTGHEKRGVE